MKRSYLSFVAILGLAVSVASLPSCTKKTEGCTDSEAVNYNPEAEEDDGSCDNSATIIRENTTWTADQIWTLEGKVVVASGTTLTIEAGTIIKGAAGTGTTASALIVERGAKIMAEGTSTNPIIFTSAEDDIAIGQLVGSNLGKTDNEKWGGIIILGNAPVSTESGDTEGNIEGISADLGFGAYGGSNASDNSGVLSYVSIRHGGITIGEGNEINGLTLGGVGSGTTINNIEIYATLDDGIECFGGTVNIADALVFFQGDDGIDLDQNYSGTINGFAVIHGDGVGTDEGLEIDGPEGTTNVNGQFTLSNGICLYVDAVGSGSAGDFKSKAQGNVTNVTFNYSALLGKPVKFRTKFADPGVDCTHKSDAYKYLVDASGSQSLVFTNCDVDGGVKVYDGDESGECLTELTAAQTEAATFVVDGAGSTYNFVQQFSWGAAGQRGEL